MGLSADPEVVDAILGHQLDLLRLEAGTRARVLRLLADLQRDLTAKIDAGGLTDWSKARIQALLRQANETIDSYYLRIQGELELTMSGVAQAQAAHISDLLTISVSASLPTETFFARLVSNVLIHGAPSAAWWERQSESLAFKFANVVRQGATAGMTGEEIVRRITGSPRLGIPGIMEVSRSQARGLVHTSIQTVANASRMETFRKNKDVVKGVRQLSTFDSHTTLTCISYDDQTWDLDGKTTGKTVLPFVNDGGSADGVPRHWGCRSVLVPETKTFRELGVDMDELPRAPRPGGKSMDDFLAGRTTEQLDEQLGKGRADLYRRGVITREQLLNLSGNPLSLAQLLKKYAPKEVA